jgi:CDGSH-type Zn-finger protein/uncharacterized Fe-S cluster protein YjdI
MTIETVRGRHATIHFDPQRCIHSRHCVLDHPDVFVPNVQGEWIHPDAAPVEELIRLGQNCPSGAIRVVRHEPTPDGLDSSDEPPLVNTVRVHENGPLAIEADLRLRGEVQLSPRATLCRCGQSANKPFCDQAHTAAGFTATGEPATGSFKSLASRNGPVDVMPLRDGPLQVVGNLELVSGTGRTFNKTTEAFLCRCGASHNKPYCDGSHKAANFQAE